MKKNFLIMAMLLAGQQAMAAPLLALPPVPKRLALPPTPQLSPNKPICIRKFLIFRNLLKSKGQLSNFEKFLSQKNIKDLISIEPCYAQQQADLQIHDQISRTEELLDMFLRKDITPHLQSFVMTEKNLELYPIHKKILAILEKNKKTLRNVVLPASIFPETKILNAQGLTPVDGKGREETVGYTDVHLTDFPNLETLKIINNCYSKPARRFLLEDLPNLKRLDIEQGSSKSRKKFEHFYFDPAYQDISPVLDCLEKFPLLKQLHINGFAHYQSGSTNLERLSHLKNLTHLSLTKAEYLKDNLSEIFKFKKLEYLDLSDSSFVSHEFIGTAWITRARKITNHSLNGIESLTELRYLGLARTGVTNLNSIQNLKKLEYLNLAHSDIESLKGINNLENLRILYLRENTKGLSDLLEISDSHLSKLKIFLQQDDFVSDSLLERLTQKGVCFLRHQTHTKEMACAYKENPFWDRHLQKLIQE